MSHSPVRTKRWVFREASNYRSRHQANSTLSQRLIRCMSAGCLADAFGLGTGFSHDVTFWMVPQGLFRLELALAAHHGSTAGLQKFPEKIAAAWCNSADTKKPPEMHRRLLWSSNHELMWAIGRVCEPPQAGGRPYVHLTTLRKERPRTIRSCRYSRRSWERSPSW